MACQAFFPFYSTSSGSAYGYNERQGVNNTLFRKYYFNPYYNPPAAVPGAAPVLPAAAELKSTSTSFQQQQQQQQYPHSSSSSSSSSQASQQQQQPSSVFKAAARPVLADAQYTSLVLPSTTMTSSAAGGTLHTRAPSPVFVRPSPSDASSSSSTTTSPYVEQHIPGYCGFVRSLQAVNLGDRFSSASRRALQQSPRKHHRFDVKELDQPRHDGGEGGGAGGDR